jgi:hypothetical protein
MEDAHEIQRWIGALVAVFAITHASSRCEEGNSVATFFVMYHSANLLALHGQLWASADGSVL